MLSENKIKLLKKLSNENNIIAALAIDQRGAIKKMIAKENENCINDKFISDFKVLVSQELTKYSSSILLDPEYGIPASKVKDENCGLLFAYEKTGYDITKKGRLPDLLDNFSARRLVEKGADAIKILIYYDKDDDENINDIKRAFVERVGDECKGLDVAYFLEIVTYSDDLDVNSKEYAKIKPKKVIGAMKEFSKTRYNVDVLKVEVPVNMKYVEGFCDKKDIIYSRNEALKLFKEQSDITNLPFIFLSAGVSSELFKETLKFAKEADSKFNGVLCGRATWAGSVKEFVNSYENGKKWLETKGKENITSLNEVLKITATPWSDKIK